MTISKRGLVVAAFVWAVTPFAGAALIAHASAPVTPPAVSFEDEQRQAGREFWGDLDGHKDCWAQVGDTSYVECRDGYLTSS
ncbi:hypothetical protein [Streptomyces sp. NPDC006134]|uniref:hypothetical protein n=1 Tax=Streptomyces sp. NPDC006134 TaxID=3154467 RepID=UPI0033CDF280